ncbi:MAG: hypothetical protein ACQEXJ_21440 [Myxococcota bacterium]
MAGWVALVAEEYSHGRLPYGIDYTDNHFESATGRWVDENGLTCATLVVALFEAQGHETLQRDTWKSRTSDSSWQEKILHLLETRSGCSQEYLEEQRSRVGCLRFRPEEVAVGIALYPPSVCFSCAEPLGHGLVRLVGRR